ncbi:MAG: beta-lactamase family protein [bacterium]|nr:beta-lactamase family protein [bacterium]
MRMVFRGSAISNERGAGESTPRRFLPALGCAAVLLAQCSGTPGPAVRDYAPDAKLQAAGMAPDKLRAAVDYVMDPAMSTKGLVVLRKGQVMVEAYENTDARQNKHTSYSVAKSFTSALVGIAIGEGLLQLDDPVCRYYEAWDCADAADSRSRITIRHLLTLTSGLNWHEDWSCPMTKFRLAFRNSDAVYMDLALTNTPPDYVLNREGKHEPGESFSYSTGDPALLSRIIEKVSGMTHFEYARQKIFEPLNIQDVSWDSDADGHTRSYARLHMRTRDYAKLGRLYAQNGIWNGVQIVPAAWVRESTDPANGPGAWYAYLWHANLAEKFNRPETTIPPDAFMARGIFGQWVAVVPSLDLVVAKNANDQCALDEALFLEKIVAAVAVER